MVSEVHALVVCVLFCDVSVAVSFVELFVTISATRHQFRQQCANFLVTNILKYVCGAYAVCEVFCMYMVLYALYFSPG